MRWTRRCQEASANRDRRCLADRGETRDRSKEKIEKPSSRTDRGDSRGDQLSRPPELDEFASDPIQGVGGRRLLHPIPASPVPPSRPSGGEVMLSIAKSSLAPVLGQRVPLRGPARMLFSSYSRTSYQPQECVTRVTTALGDTFDADLSSSLEWQLWAFGSYQKHFAELFGYLVRPGNRCVDVGANVGVHTVRLARLVGADGEVIAIEPDPDVVQRTNRNIALNGLVNVRVISAAASERAGETRLFRPSPWDTNRGQGEPPAPPLPDRRPHHGPAGDGRRRLRRCAGRADQDRRGRPRGRRGPRGGRHDCQARAIDRLRLRAEAARGCRASAVRWLAERGYTMFRVRAARHRITGRARLALDLLREPPVEGGDLLAVTPQVAAGLPCCRRRRGFDRDLTTMMMD